ncbi:MULTISPECIES: regulatory protein GemA [unclassified Xanthobacter]|uniref:regulatory protein GemA n=1 Tax=unclassified Xanthobacter TaxID=2623496 RepID=UPI001EDE0970|nr:MULTISPECIES: regulatory protein GemA [unclassified Xanthobacter]
MIAISSGQIGAIHAASKRLGLNEAERRDMIAAVAGGKRSCRELTAGEAVSVINRLNDLQGGAGAAGRADGPYRAKLQVLWLSAWNLGVVEDKRDTALHAFVRRQTGLDHSRFLHDAADASRAVDAIKAWLARAADVHWPSKGGARASKIAVLAAQQRRLAALGVDVPARSIGELSDAEIDAAIRTGGAALRRALKRVPKED